MKIRARLVRVLCLLTCAGMLLSLSGCKTLGALAGKLVKKPTAKYKSMRLRDVSLKGLAMDFDFILNNPNAVGVTFTEFAYDLKFDGNRLFNGKTTKGVRIAAGGSSPLRVPFAIEFEKFVKSLMVFFQKRDSVPYHLRLVVGFKTPIGNIVLPPMDIRGNVPIPKLPKVEMVGVDLANLSFTGAQVNFKVGLTGQGKYSVSPRALNYGLRVSGVQIGGGTTRLRTLKAGQRQVVNIPLNIQFLKVGMAIANVIRSRKLPYNFTGNVDMGFFKIPVNLKGSANL